MSSDTRAPVDATLDPTRIESCWQQLLEMDSPARAAWLHSVEAADPDIARVLRTRLDSLGADTSAGEPGPAHAEDAIAMPRRFGGFTLIKRIGAGGMGEVWLADQDHPRRQVALKLIRGGLSSADALKRFQREATLASRAEHPSIARVYEAGNADTGQGSVPYLAMEYVVGEGLREYLQQQRPSLRERLALIAVIAEAVHHAHVRGVIHRDLKPQNILVGADGVPKVLDFGVARALEDSTPGATRMTMAGQLVGTLAYMSPEQLAGDPLAVDARSDVYALGIIAYEALSGQAPFQINESSILEAIKVRSRQQPEALGKRHRELRGDIELIVMKALADEPNRRYQSAHEFAEDIERYLGAMPIKARAPTRAYLWSRFAQRNRLALVAGALVLAAIVIGALVSLRFALAEADARREAELRTAKSEAVTAFLNDMLANADPTNARGRDLKLSEVLTSAATTLDVSPPAEPQVEAGIRVLLVEIFRNLGDFEAAQKQVAAAQRAARKGYAADAVEAIEVDRNEVAVLLDLEKVDEAQQKLDALYARVDPRTAPPTLLLKLANNRAAIDIVRGNFQTALDALDQAIAASKLPPDADALKSARSNRVVLLNNLGRPDDAVVELTRMIADQSAELGADHPSVVRLRAELAVTYDGQGKAKEAEALLREVLADETRMFGPDNVETIATSLNLLKLLVERKALDEAEPMADRVVAVHTALFGEDHERVRRARNIRAVLYEERGAPDQAQAEYEAIIASYARTVGLDHPEALVARNNLAKMFLTLGRHAEAVEAYAGIVKDAESKLGAAHFYTAIFSGNYGDALRQAKDPRARTVLEEAYSRCAAALGPEHERTRRVATWLADDATERGDQVAQAKWQELAKAPP